MNTLELLIDTVQDPKNATKPLTRTVEKTALITWFKFSNRIVLYKRQDDDLIYGIHFQCNKYDEEFKVFLRELVPVKIDAVGPLYEEDVLLAKVYVDINTILMILTHHTSYSYDRFYCMYVNSAKYLLDMYKITYKQKPNEFTDKRISINLYTPGSVRISIVDNLIISHNIAKNVSMIYDIKAHETIQDNTLGFLVSPLPMTAIENEGNRIIEKYPECVFLLPNLVVNKGNGKIQKINVDLKSLSDSFSDPCLLNSFLLRRTRGKPYILEHLSQLMTDRKNLESLGVIFNQINTVLCAHQRKNGAKSPSSVAIAKERVLQYWSNSKETTPITLPENQVVNMENGKIVIDQHDMYTKVFVPLEETCTDSKYMVSIFSEYIKSLNFLGIKVDSFIYELIINVLVRNKRFYQLHQLLQYYVINDSHHVACQLLHIQSMYPPALQLALDMLKRLNDSSQIVEVLFTKGMVLNALKYLNSFPEKSVIKPLAPRFLEEAKKKNDLSLFHITYTFFKSNNFIDESCSEYVEYYKETCVHNQAPEL